MSKLDISQLVKAHDSLLAVLENPRHRQIVENYRRHLLLEVLGRWQEILAPDMTVADPLYILTVSGEGGYLRGASQVAAFYAQWVSTGQNVLVMENEDIAVGDRGLGKESVFSQYFKGDSLRQMGFYVDEPDSWYIKRVHSVSYFPYDESARLIGEHGGSVGTPEIFKITPQEVVTQEEANEKLTPLLHPLPVFERA
jgi:hypothetical protein